MCEKCKPLNDQIERYRRIGLRITDPQTLQGIKQLIENLEAQKATLHPKA
jgi:hypothetical protein